MKILFSYSQLPAFAISSKTEVTTAVEGNEYFGN